MFHRQPRRRHPVSPNSSPSHSSPSHPPSNATDHCSDFSHYGDDDEVDKGKRPKRGMFQSFILGSRNSFPKNSPLRQHASREIDPTSYRGRRRRVIRISLVLLAVCAGLHHWPRRRGRSMRYRSVPVVINLLDLSNANDNGGWDYHVGAKFDALSSLKPLERSTNADYGSVHIVSLQYAPNFQRKISPNDYLVNERLQRRKFNKGENKEHTHVYFQKSEESLSLECQRQNWQGLSFPNCNTFHEISLEAEKSSEYYDSSLISHGAFRDAWILQSHHLAPNASERVVLKSLRIKKAVDVERMKEMQREAIIMERLTSTPRIVNGFGYCGTSTIVELVPFEVEEFIIPDSGMAKQEDLDELDDVHPMNNYTVAEKLQMALEMAESLADLHGYEGGVIVHDDVQLCQWLQDSNGKLKLGDFNRAEMMEYSAKNESYCKYENGYVHGNYRSPEEMRDDPLDEKIDVYSFGNNIYGLLTGLWVFYENDDDGVVQDKTIAGERAYIDDRYRTRSFVEGKLVELMERCWIDDPSERVDIFEAVQFLRRVKNESEKQ